jgi:D-aspartate ligase
VTAKRRPDLDGGTAALVFKFGRSRLHHGSLAVIRSLGRAGVPVYAVLSDEQVPARHSRYLRGGFVWPAAVHADGYRSGAAKTLLAGLTRIIEIIDRPTVLIATDDQAATFLAERRAVLPSGCLVPGCPDDLPGKLIDKRTCTELIRAAGLPVPPQRVRCGPLVPGPDLGGLQLPLVLKRTLRTLRPDGSRTWSTLRGTSRAQLQAVLTDDTDGPFDVLVQALVPGQDWLYHGYRCVAGRPVVSFTGRKLRSRPAGAGETAYGVAETHSRVREVAETLLASIGYVGPVSMDLRLDPDSDRVYVLDVNPRIGACFRMFGTTAGVDVARAMHLDLTGRPVPGGPQRDGVRYLVESYDWAVRRAYGRPLPAWLVQVMRADERAWTAATDLRPALVRLVDRRASAQLADPDEGPRFVPGRHP